MNFLKCKRIPFEHKKWSSHEMTYYSDSFKVRALMVAPDTDNADEVKDINVYLRGGKGQVGRVRLGRLLQFMRDDTVVVAPYYRGSNGSEGMDELAGRDVEDVVALIGILRDRYTNARVNLIAFSRGGLQAMNTIRYVKVNSLLMLNAVSSIYQMYDERVDLRGMMRRMVGHPKKEPEQYDLREAILHELYLPRMLVIHGSIDRLVDIENARILTDYLDSVGHPYIFEVFDGERHALTPRAVSAMKRLFWENVEKMGDIRK